MACFWIASFLLASCFSRIQGEYVYDENGEYVFQEYLRWNYTYMNPTCFTPSGRNPCQDIRVCNFAAASIAIGGWPTLCGWVGKGVPKVCCGLPLVLGPALMKKVDEEISRKRECGTTTYDVNLSKTRRKFFDILHNLPEVGTSDPNKFDPPLDLSGEAIASSTSYSGSRQGEFPWMVSVRQNGEHICGGSLVDRKHILTAAHCLDEEFKEYTIHVGNLFVADGYPINVTKTRIHPGYNKERRYKDLALLTLEQEILTPSIPHICLPKDDPTIFGSDITLLRWNTLHNNEETKQKLCISEPLKIVPIENCLRIEGDQMPKELFEDYICTEGIGSNQQACEKGFGGPVIYKSTSDNPTSDILPWFIIGVDTEGPTYNEARSYGLFTNVVSFLEWIKDIIKEDSSLNPVRYDR